MGSAGTLRSMRRLSWQESEGQPGPPRVDSSMGLPGSDSRGARYRFGKRFDGPPRASQSELLCLRGVLEGEGGGALVRDDLGDLIEVSRADLALMTRGRIAPDLRRELSLLELGVRRHPVLPVAPRELEHAVVERVEPGERDELELVPHRGELLLERRDGQLVEVLLP